MIAFWALGTILIASAVWTITARKPVYSVVGLLLNFATLAVLYVTLSAEFLAVIQIIVYSGAILILFVFVIAHWLAYLMVVLNLILSDMPVPEPVVSRFILQWSAVITTIVAIITITITDGVSASGRRWG